MAKITEAPSLLFPSGTATIITFIITLLLDSTVLSHPKSVGLLLSKDGHDILKECNDLRAHCVNKGETSIKALTQKKSKSLLPFLNKGLPPLGCFKWI